MKKVLLSGLAALVVAALAVYFLFPGVLLSLAQRAELSAAGLERKEIDVAGHHIVYLEGGSGPSLFLFHGFGADKSNWARAAKELTPRFRVVAPDLPGFGESTREPSARYGIADQAERLHALAESLGLGPAHVGGNSMGGAIAGAYAARYPQQVQSLWLIAPGSVESAEPSELDRRIAEGDNPFLIENAIGFERLLDLAFVERPSIPGPIVAYLAEESIKHSAFNQKIGRDLESERFVLETALKGLPVKTLITWGDHDRFCHVSGADVLRGVLPQAKLHILPNVGHIPMVERPEETARAFLEFAGG